MPAPTGESDEHPTANHERPATGDVAGPAFTPTKTAADAVILACDIDQATRGINWAREQFPAHQRIAYSLPSGAETARRVAARDDVPEAMRGSHLRMIDDIIHLPLRTMLMKLGRPC